MLEVVEVVEVVSILQPGYDSSVRLGPSAREERSGLSGEDRVRPAVTGVRRVTGGTHYFL